MGKENLERNEITKYIWRQSSRGTRTFLETIAFQGDDC